MKVDGVKEAKADHQKGSAWAKYDPSKTSPEKLVEAVNKSTPFKASLKGEEAASPSPTQITSPEAEKRGDIRLAPLSVDGSCLDNSTGSHHPRRR